MSSSECARGRRANCWPNGSRPDRRRRLLLARCLKVRSSSLKQSVCGGAFFLIFQLARFLSPDRGPKISSDWLRGSKARGCRDSARRCSVERFETKAFRSVSFHCYKFLSLFLPFTSLFSKFASPVGGGELARGSRDGPLVVACIKEKPLASWRAGSGLEPSANDCAIVVVWLTNHCVVVVVAVSSTSWKSAADDNTAPCRDRRRRFCGLFLSKAISEAREPH